MPVASTEAESIKFAINAAYGNGVDFTASGSEIGSLVLWLGGFPNSDGKLSGFYADPENPFTPIDAFDQKAFVDWEIGEGKGIRFVDFFDNGFTVPVIVTDIQNTFVPFIYFQGKSSGGHDAYMIPDTMIPGTGHPKKGQAKQFDFSTSAEFAVLGFCVPYAEEENGGVIKWKQPSTFQLIHPGLDGKFGEPAPKDPTVAPLRVIKTGDNIGPQNLDDLTNISNYKELKSILP
jgi:hypothetical protein